MYPLIGIPLQRALSSPRRCRITDRFVVGCCSWNFLAWLQSFICCYGGYDSETPCCRTFGEPLHQVLQKNLTIGFCPWCLCCAQVFCVVDCCVGPICINAADCCITMSASTEPEACCCVVAAGGFKQFDRLHWSLWNCSPLRWCCCPGVEPLDDSAWNDILPNNEKFFGFGCC